MYGVHSRMESAKPNQDNPAMFLRNVENPIMINPYKPQCFLGSPQVFSIAKGLWVFLIGWCRYAAGRLRRHQWSFDDGLRPRPGLTPMLRPFSCGTWGVFKLFEFWFNWFISHANIGVPLWTHIWRAMSLLTSETITCWQSIILGHSQPYHIMPFGVAAVTHLYW